MVNTKKSLSPGASAQRGFSLVEALVVVMVILVIAAIAIPSLIQSRMKANEAAAVASMKTIQTAETLYSTEFPEEGFAPSLAVLGPNGTDCSNAGPTNSCIIMDDALASGLKSGYIFVLTGDGNTPTRAYTLTASPESSSASGRCTFSSNQTGLISKTVSGSGSGSGTFTVGTSGTCD
ncbi:MAG: prepilin-type N-terminal cleavage/methylation domain-containing protein [Acidobacteriia bacterium]|nr:prepilin-type N-terminal cleavage/methylation domain-containing protein [Terriglobia bacterium]